MDLRLDKIPVPDSFPVLMKDFCKSAILVQPPDLLYWSWLYFQNCGGKFKKVDSKLSNFKQYDSKIGRAGAEFNPSDTQSIADPGSGADEFNTEFKNGPDTPDSNPYFEHEQKGVSSDANYSKTGAFVSNFDFKKDGANDSNDESKVCCFRIEINRWHLPIVLESHLSPRSIQMLTKTLTDQDGYIAVKDIRSYWTGHLMNPAHLEDLLNIVSSLPYQYLSRALFLTLATGHVCPNLRHTLYTICNLLYEDRMVPVDEFLEVYRYLAVLDMGGECEKRSIHDGEDSYEDSEPPPHYQFSNPDYVHIPYAPSTSLSSSSQLYSPSVCNSEHRIHAWQELVPQETPTCDDIRQALIDENCNRDNGVGHNRGSFNSNFECDANNEISTENSGGSFHASDRLLSRGMLCCSNRGEGRTPPVAQECASRDGLPMWTEEMDAEGYVGVLEFVRRQLDPIAKSLEADINHLLSGQLTSDDTDQSRGKDRRLNVEIKKLQFQRELQDATHKANRDAYDENCKEDEDEKLEIIREHYKTLKELDEQMKMLRQKLMDYQEGHVIDIEDLLKSALERRIGDYSYQKVGEIQDDTEKCYTDEQKILQQKFGKYLRPFIVENVNHVLNLVDCVLGIPMIRDCTRSLNDAQEALSQVVNFVLDIDGTPCMRDEPASEPLRKCAIVPDCPQPVPSQLSFESDWFNLSVSLARTPGLRYCVPGIGARVPRGIIEQVMCYFKSKSSEQCGMIRGSNVIDILCPPLQ